VRAPRKRRRLNQAPPAHAAPQPAPLPQNLPTSSPAAAPPRAPCPAPPGDDIAPACLRDVFASFAKFGIHGREARTPGGGAATPGSAGGKPPRFSASGTPGSATKAAPAAGEAQMDGFRCGGATCEQALGRSSADRSQASSRLVAERPRYRIPSPRAPPTGPRPPRPPIPNPPGRLPPCRFAKLCREARLVDGKKLTPTAVDLIFTKAKARVGAGPGLSRPQPASSEAPGSPRLRTRRPLQRRGLCKALWTRPALASWALPPPRPAHGLHLHSHFARTDARHPANFLPVPGR
jgi:hypothetical protein